MRTTENIMDYCHTHRDATIRYCESQMKLHIHRNTSYLSVYKLISKVVGYFFLSDHFDPSSPTKHNGEVLVIAAILKISWSPPHKQNLEACLLTPRKMR